MFIFCGLVRVFKPIRTRDCYRNRHGWISSNSAYSYQGLGNRYGYDHR